jgi:integrase
MARTQRIRIAQGIYQDSSGIAAVVQVGSGSRRRQREQRFPLGTALEALVDWQVRTRRLLEQPVDETVTVGGNAGTLRADGTRYLATVTSMPSYEARRADLEAWMPMFGHRATHSLMSQELNLQLDTWASATPPVAASTLNHRRQALRAVWEFVAPGAPSPIDGTQRRTPPPLQARALTWDDALELVVAFPANTRTGAMLRVMAHTGLPPARIARLLPTQVNPVARTAFLEGRRKGQGTASKTIPLTDAAVSALHEHFRYFPQGGSVAKNSWIVVFHRSVGRVNAERARTGRPPLPPTVRPYDLRHTFGTETYRRTGDLQAAAAVLDVTLETAQRYTLGAVSEQALKARDAMNQPVWPASAPDRLAPDRLAPPQTAWHVPGVPIVPERKSAEIRENSQTGNSVPGGPRLVRRGGKSL